MMCGGTLRLVGKDREFKRVAVLYGVGLDGGILLIVNRIGVISLGYVLPSSWTRVISTLLNTLSSA